MNNAGESRQLYLALEDPSTETTWRIRETQLSDRSKVYDVVGGSEGARIEILCMDRETAAKLIEILRNCQSTIIVT